MSSTNIKEFGKGELIISMGTLNGRPVVAVTRESKKDEWRITEDDWVMVFECEEKAKKVHSVLGMNYAENDNDGGDWW